MSTILQSDPSLTARDRLIFALDYSNLDEAKKAVVSLNGHVGLFKVGLELFVGSGPAIFKVISEHSDCGVFLDLKFHDIPETVQAAARAAAAYKVRFVTVHASEGKRLLKTVVDQIHSDTKVLAVTVLTSFGPEDMRDSGLNTRLDIPELVLRRAQWAHEAGCAGVVCSGSEVRQVKERIGQDLIVVVPGVRPEWTAVPNDDQVRVTIPRQAILDGADYVVVGRPIRKAKDPVQAADRIVDEIKTALGHLSIQS
ncbi:MAG TPA: orotidine-5'-phosphate decarboxylase [Nitrospiria bacterium]|nr:orotidine-5'-phosphate decarboxylase [Nitrospiria bacterium]